MSEQERTWEKENIIKFEVICEKKEQEKKIVILRPSNNESRELLDKYGHLLQGYALNLKKDPVPSVSAKSMPYTDSALELVLSFEDSTKEEAIGKMEKIKKFLESKEGMSFINTSYKERERKVADYEISLLDLGQKAFDESLK